jgi:hypothetical protein
MDFGTMSNLYVCLGIVMTFHDNLIRADSFNRDTLTLISSFLDENQITFAVIINCGTAGNYYIN